MLIIEKELAIPSGKRGSMVGGRKIWPLQVTTPENERHWPTLHPQTWSHCALCTSLKPLQFCATCFLALLYVHFVLFTCWFSPERRSGVLPQNHLGSHSKKEYIFSNSLSNGFGYTISILYKLPKFQTLP